MDAITKDFTKARLAIVTTAFMTHICKQNEANPIHRSYLAATPVYFLTLDVQQLP